MWSRQHPILSCITHTTDVSLRMDAKACSISLLPQLTSVWSHSGNRWSKHPGPRNVGWFHLNIARLISRRGDFAASSKEKGQVRAQKETITRLQDSIQRYENEARKQQQHHNENVTLLHDRLEHIESQAAQLADLSARVRDTDSCLENAKRLLADYERSNITLRRDLDVVREQLQSETEARHRAQNNYNTEEGIYRAEIDRLQRELDATEDVRRRAVVQCARSAVHAGHDYNSGYPSPPELLKNVRRLADGDFADFIDTAFEHAEEWTKAGVEETFVPSLLKDVLVSTVRECHLLAQEEVYVRLDNLAYALRGAYVEGLEFNSGRLPELPAGVKMLPALIFRQAHRYMFAELFPPDGVSSRLVDLVFFQVQRSHREQPGHDCLGMLLAVEDVAKVYSQLVMALVQTFVECELTRPKPLRFLDSFGKNEAWNDDVHSNGTIDPWYDGPTLMSPGNQVQVILPALYQAEGRDAREDETVNILSKAVIWVVSSGGKN